MQQIDICDYSGDWHNRQTRKPYTSKMINLMTDGVRDWETKDSLHLLFSPKAYVYSMDTILPESLGFHFSIFFSIQSLKSFWIIEDGG